VAVGAPTVTDVVVKAEVIGQVKGEKLLVQRYKPKKRVLKRSGHRQQYTQIRIKSIGKKGSKSEN
jgi:large subunit ribosomal protein L21